MSTSNAGIGSEESVLIAYHWPREKKTTSDLPGEIVALCPVGPSLELMPATVGLRQQLPPQRYLGAGVCDPVWFAR